MKKLLFFILVAVAAWYGWKHYPELLNRAPGNEAVVINDSGHGIERLRFTADGQTQVREDLPSGNKAVFPFKVANDSEIRLEWQWSDRLGERRWQGGRVPRGPLVGRHIMQIDGDGEVIYRPEPKS